MKSKEAPSVTFTILSMFKNVLDPNCVGIFRAFHVSVSFTSITSWLIDGKSCAFNMSAIGLLSLILFPYISGSSKIGLIWGCLLCLIINHRTTTTHRTHRTIEHRTHNWQGGDMVLSKSNYLRCNS